mgnify:FL=1
MLVDVSNFYQVPNYQKRKGTPKMRSLLIKSVLGFTILTSLTACSWMPVRQIEVSSKPIDKPELVLPPVDELNMRPVEWIVINESNVEEVIVKLKSEGKAFAIYGLTGKGYGNLGLNFSDIRALVQQQQAIIAAYEGYYQEAEEAMDAGVQP